MAKHSTQTDHFRARLFESGKGRVATIVGVCAWLQESAASHARNLGFSNEVMARAGVAWVLSRLCVRMDRYPRAGEDIAVETWPSVLERKRAIRDFGLTDAQGTIIGTATSAWTALNLEMRRLGAFPPEVVKAYPALGERACEFPGAAVPRLREPEHTVSITARRSDIDENGHVNNVHLVEWALEAVPDTRPHQHPNLIDISFRTEVPPKAEVYANCSFDGPKSLHSIVRSDGREAVRMACRWANGL